jgi:Putative zinc-finger
MNDPLLTCESLDEFLPDYLEGTLDLGRRELVEHHLTECDRCAALVRDLMAIQRQARSLPDLVPSRDLWQGIAEQIEAPVLSIPAPTVKRRRFGAAWMTAAAAALVLATASVTYVATKHASEQRALAVAPKEPRGTVPAESLGAQYAGLSAQVTYDREIERLRTIVSERRTQLDTATVSVIEKNLKVIDQAIAQSRAALAKDPASRFLNDQLNRALDMKVELLRTVALLPAGT